MEFEINKVLGWKLVDKYGNEVPDVRDIMPVEKKLDLNKSLLDLAYEVTPPLEYVNKEFCTKFGYLVDGIGTFWNRDRDAMEFASAVDLWQYIALCNTYWMLWYDYNWHKETYEFRKYKREHGDTV